MFNKLFFQRITKIFLLGMFFFFMITYFPFPSKNSKNVSKNLSSVKKVRHYQEEEGDFFPDEKRKKNNIKTEIVNGETYLTFAQYNEKGVLLQESKFHQNGTFSLSYKNFYPNGQLKTVRENYQNSDQIHFIRQYNKKGVLYEGETFSLQGKTIGKIINFPDEGLIQEKIYHPDNEQLSQVLEYTSEGQLMRSWKYFFDPQSLKNNLQRFIEYDADGKILKITDFYQHFKQKVIYDRQKSERKNNLLCCLNFLRKKTNHFYDSKIH
ncbi:hypothetical protein [Vaccinium witches'-broom phytoplasma]|uniref:hypothetical protein n=1 Tax=Vaccinium witches'-broom phytoplasma TaxID=85642 RepID=UPI000372C04F|nr:hypothetical protein [Vaccinium witches'-broom phytoplasma]